MDARIDHNSQPGPTLDKIRLTFRQSDKRTRSNFELIFTACVRDDVARYVVSYALNKNK